MNGTESMARITYCPPGEARGARDLQAWSQRRARGWSGTGKEFDWVDQHTRQDATITCRRCRRVVVIALAPARLRMSKLRCTECGSRNPSVRFSGARATE